MRTVVVKREIHAPIEKVFDLLADHANYKDFPGVRASQLLREGSSDRNGTGAVRRIDTAKGWFREEITAYERPRHFAYRIVETNLPLEHRGGRLDFTATASGTLVTWTTTLRITVPLIGGLLTRLAGGTVQKAFGSMLNDVARRLETGDVQRSAARA